MLDRVLRRQHHERFVENRGAIAESHLPLLHDLEERRLHLGRGPVDLVGEEHLGEDRALASDEPLLVLVVDQRADEIGRQKVGSELNTLKVEVDHLRQRLDGQRLRQARDALEQNVSARQERDQETIEHRVLADDHPLHLLLRLE